MTDEMDHHWKMPEHVPSDQYSLWAVERVWFRLRAQCRRSADGSVELSDACKIILEIIEPMMRKVEEQGFDGFGAYLARHRRPAPHFGPNPLQPSLTETQAETWWSSKTPRERYYALSGDSFEYDIEMPGAVLVGFGTIGEQVAVIPIAADWDDIADNDRDILLANMRRGWVNMLERIRPS